MILLYALHGTLFVGSLLMVGLWVWAMLPPRDIRPQGHAIALVSLAYVLASLYLR